MTSRHLALSAYVPAWIIRISSPHTTVHSVDLCILASSGLLTRRDREEKASSACAADAESAPHSDWSRFLGLHSGHLRQRITSLLPALTPYVAAHARRGKMYMRA